MSDLFDSLVWDQAASIWRGTCVLDGNELAVDIEFDEVDPPTTDEMAEAKGAISRLFEKLTPQSEQKLRKAAAAELTHAAHCQSDHEPTEDDVNKLYHDMQLRSLSFTYSCQEQWASGILGYDAPTEYPKWRLQINFSSDLEIDDVMAIEPS